MRIHTLVGLAFCAALGFLCLSDGRAYAQGITRVCQQAIGANGSNNCTDVGPGGTSNGQTTQPFAVSGITNLATYTAAVGAFGNSSAGDLSCIAASATKTVYVKHISVSAIASAGVADDIGVVRRSTADTGGTPTVLSNTSADSTNAAGSATVTMYATAPSAGTLVGSGVRWRTIPITTSTAPVGAFPAIFHFSGYYDQAQVLKKGSTEQLCVNVPATSGGQWSVDWEWVEQ